MTSEDFAGALRQLRARLGDEQVRLADGKAPDARGAGGSPPTVTVFPDTTEDVAAVLRIAAEHHLRLGPVAGPALTAGAASDPPATGQLILRLDRLNRILAVNEDLAFVLVEAGVTQQQLSDFLREKRVRLWTDGGDLAPDTRVVAAALAREVGATPDGDRAARLCGLEVALSTGEVVRTGGGPKHGLTWNLTHGGTGPALDGLFSQSRFGVVTRAGLWLMPVPEAFRVFLLEVRDPRSQSAVVDELRGLALRQAVPANLRLLNADAQRALVGSPATAQLPATDAAATGSDEGGLGPGPWLLAGAIYGARPQVAASQDLVRRALGRFGPLTFLDEAQIRRRRTVAQLWRRARQIPLLATTVGPVFAARYGSAERAELAHQLFRRLQGRPVAADRGGARPAGRPSAESAGSIAFDRRRVEVLCPLTGRLTNELIGMAESRGRAAGYRLAVTLVLRNARTAVAQLDVWFPANNPAERARAEAVAADLAAATAQAGFQPAQPTASLTLAPEYQDLIDRLQGALDPGGVFGPVGRDQGT